MGRTALKIIFMGISLFMIGVAVQTSLADSLWEAWPRLSREPWMSATLIDFYFNIVIISAWVIYKEAKKISAFFWVLAFITLGSIATAFYVFLQLARLKDSDPFEKVFLRRE